MRVRIPGLLLAATIGLSGLLTACGDDDAGADKPAKDETSQSTESTDATDSTEGSEPDADEGDGDKPARDAVVAGYSGIVKKGGEDAGIPMPEDVVTKVVSCFVDAVYDDASATTLQALADGNAAAIDPADVNLFTEAQTTCQKALG
ncbi:hypothetical protein [Pimelobacter simplex]|uniref:hypothetical protein n=1 Tax=Nocardioides simplex TaxID=2045 RepID=UPI0021503A83|nr:hypothetical protein [Pimelobacter simplex]UUW89617.1 hypothetical protein M0M43_28390 [Pimelobacter simplex]UUW93446.1 hypothetical protein M0M48_17045 [Pimelobacter simplex]